MDTHSNATLFLKNISFVRQILIVGLVVVGFAQANVSYAATPDQKTDRVLFINSYHRNYAWSDGIEQAFRDHLEASGKKIDVFIEFLDTYRFADLRHLPALADILAVKHKKMAYRAVAVSDNNAFHFAVKYRDRIFPGVPIVFCGYNEFKPEVLKGVKNITGIIEEADFKGTVDMALTVHPQTKKLVFITSDAVSTTRVIQEYVEQVLIPLYRERYEVIHQKNLLLQETEKRLSALSSQTLVFVFRLPFDHRERQEIPVKDYFRRLAAASIVPVYTFWDFGIGAGTMGGNIVTGHDQGRAAAALMLKILDGTPADHIPVVMETPTSKIFDFNALRRFNVGGKMLPPGAQVINRPNTFYERYKQYVWVTIGVFVVLILFVFILSLLLQKSKNLSARLLVESEERQKALKSLQENREHLEELVAERTADLRLTNDALGKSEQQLALSIAGSGVGLWDWQVRTGQLAFNERWAQLMGYTLQELMPANIRTWIEFIHPDDFGKSKALLQKHFDSELPMYECEVRMRHKDGSWVWILNRGKVVEWDKEGRPVRMAGTHLDITQRKRAEEALRQSEEKYRDIFENASEGIYQTTPDGRYLSVNPALARTLGYESPSEIAEAVYSIDQQIYTDPSRRLEFKRLLSEFGYVRDFEAQLNRKDTQKIWVTINADAVKDREGNIVMYQGTIMDVTEKKRLESQLQQDQKLKSIGTLAGGIAHDFNNLLMGIQGYSTMMQLEISPSHPHYGYLKSIQEQVASGADLTRRLLGFAQGGRYEMKPTNMNEIIEKTSSMFGRTKKEITLHGTFSKDLWAVEADRGQIESVFMNLYVNAWQAMPKGGEISLATENVLLTQEEAFLLDIHAGKYVKMTVTDTGTGMDAETLERIFDPFFTTKGMDSGRGTGLGLASAYGIIKGHKGVIMVNSQVGQGTTFSIYLPASDKEIPMKKEVETAPLAGTETILLVDDEKTVLEVTRRMLESLGYGVYVASNGQEALDFYGTKKGRIDLVILDMIMPGISGGETFDRLREMDPEIRVLLSSGYSIDGEAQEILKRGCNGFLQKPFQMNTLSQRIRETLV